MMPGVRHGSMPHSRRPPTGSLILILVSACLLAWTYHVGIGLGMADSVSKVSVARARAAIAIAISHMEYGATGYVLYDPVFRDLMAGGFGRPGPDSPPLDINGAIANALGRGYQLQCDSGPPGLCADHLDDKEYADYVTVAFTLFGFNVQALYNLYFLLLAISLAAFCAQFVREPAYLALAPLLLAAHYAAVLVLRDSIVTYVVHDSRFLPAVACLAAIHVALVVLHRSRSSVREIPLLAIQVMIMVFVLDSRSSAIYLFCFILGVAMCSMLVALKNGSGLKPILRNKGWIVGIVIAAPVLLSIYKQIAYDHRYLGDGTASHTVWHAIYMGLSVHPTHSANDMAYSDMAACDAGYRALLANPEKAPRILVSGSPADDDSVALEMYPNCSWIKYTGWSVYDQFAGAATAEFIQTHPRYALESYLLYKPLAVVQQLQWQLALREVFPDWWNLPSLYLPAQRDVLDLFQPPALLAVILAIGCAYPYRTWAVARDWVLLTGGLFLASLVPSIIVAPIYYEMPVVFLTFCLAVYAGVGAGVLMASQVWGRLRTSRPGPAPRLREAAG